MRHLIASVLFAASVRALGADALLDAASRLAPGATIEVPDGNYTTTQPVRIEGKRGTADAPLVLRAQQRGKAVIGGVAGFVLKDCEHVVLEGFVFEHDSHDHAVLLDNCRHVRVTRNVFRLRERAKPRHMEHWVYAIGARSGHNRIDHNRFERKTNAGSPVFVRGDDATLTGSQHDRIDHNHFLDTINAGDTNGHETIRTGSNDLGASDRGTFTVIEHNLLERCSGEQEIISLKSSDNIVRHNTFVNCRGAICLRSGHRTQVHDNFVLNLAGTKGCGGVKLYGFDHRIWNNYFLGLTGTDHEAPLALIPGTLDTPTTTKIGKQYQDLTTVPPTRAWIGFNTWIDCAALEFGGQKPDKVRKHVPAECVFINNVVVRTKPNTGPLVKLGLVRDLDARDNVGHAPGEPPREKWASWFHWEAAPPATKPIPTIDATAVGPDAD